ncbi:MAG: class I SAM-dependent methyltransferase [Pseudomonadota bacterium]|nr:class I SAM-dependent methyltransferase [Pseudomonadota bacterium]MDE3037536.1 class I SAM-dependent methyltransferase [Pseudomonadota bacterium]
MLWGTLLDYLVRSGDLTIIDARGKTHRFGRSGDAMKSTVRLHNSSLHYKLFFYPEFYLGESYMNGQLTLEEGNLHDFLSILAINFAVSKPTLPEKIAEKLTPLTQKIQQYNPVGHAQKNVAPHYDISDRLYALFLDQDWHYTCAYYTDPSNSLEQAQQDKIRHVASKLRLEPGMKVLDAGCGWGGLAMYLARVCGVDVTGVTLSGEQAAKANKRAGEAGLSDSVRFLQKDFRTMTGTFDRVVSVGMMEHIGAGFYKELFARTRALLTDDGIALFHCIGRLDGPGTTNPWLRKYIFPGGYAPALSEVTKAIEKSDLLMTDIEILRMHYAYTLRDWQQRFRANWKKAAALYDERFCRMWEFYLVSAEMDFRYLSTMIFHIQLTKDVNTLPIVRDYMVDWERAHSTSCDERCFRKMGKYE